MSQFKLSHCPPNPTLEFAEGIKIPMGTTEIVSRGGGSTLDVAKWLAKKYSLRHTAIPTTGGTGSEVTKYVVLTVDGKKTTFTDEDFIPDEYILDPHLLTTLSKEQTISSGLDALSQSMEALWSRKTTLEAQTYATTAMELILNSLQKCIDDPKNTQARMDLLIAANLSGRAINIAPTNVCHAISYPLTDWYGIPHGIACGMTLSYFAEKANFKLKDFIKPLVKRAKIDHKKVAEEAINNPKIKDYPYPVTVMDIIRALS